MGEVLVKLGTSRVTSKGQVTIPENIRRAEGIREGTDLVFVDIDGVVVMEKAVELERLFTVFEEKARELTLTPGSLEAELEAEKARTWKERYARASGH